MWVVVSGWRCGALPAWCPLRAGGDCRARGSIDLATSDLWILQSQGYGWVEMTAPAPDQPGDRDQGRSSRRRWRWRPPANHRIRIVAASSTVVSEATLSQISTALTDTRVAKADLRQAFPVVVFRRRQLRYGHLHLEVPLVDQPLPVAVASQHHAAQPLGHAEDERVTQGQR